MFNIRVEFGKNNLSAYSVPFMFRSILVVAGISSSGKPVVSFKLGRKERVKGSKDIQKNYIKNIRMYKMLVKIVNETCVF
mmetsp:Transcript_16940/g.23396  ORF Transcript_16940/g.23396 Transcript_16940/m.23396 type:complete len:80 (-) Transcript_16940:180-419(-)